MGNPKVMNHSQKRHNNAKDLTNWQVCVYSHEAHCS